MNTNKCFNCGSKFYANRSDQLFCSKSCRYKYNRGYLVLTLKKQWFNMILSGGKTEEYREIKPYWEKRFINYFGQYYDFSTEETKLVWSQQPKTIVFRNGYGKDAPQFTAECTIREDYGKTEWGAEEGKRYYVLTIDYIHDIRNREKGSKKNGKIQG